LYQLTPLCVPEYLCEKFKFLTPWSSVLLENVVVLQLVKKFHTFFGTLMIMTAFRRASHPSLSRSRSIYSTPLTDFLKIHFNVIVSSTPRSTMWSVSLRFPHQMSWRQTVLNMLENQRWELDGGRTDMINHICLF
jgi:hypothetical protein